MNLLVLFISSLIFRTVCQNERQFQELIFGELYSNWTTRGNLVPILFKVVVKEGDRPPAIRVSINSEKVTLKNPLTVNVIRGKTVHNIGLPRIQSNQDKKFTYWFATDTLCDDDRSLEQLGQPVFLSIASSLPSDFSLLVKPVPNFHIDKKPLVVLATPPEPRYYLYKFPEDMDKVDIRAYSDSDICARLIVRRANKEDIGPEVHLAFVVNPDDRMCGTTPNMTDNPYRLKETRIEVVPVAEQTFAYIIPLLVYAMAMISVFLLTYFKYRLVDCYENNEPSIFEGNDSEANVILDKTWLFDKPHMIVSHKEYEKQRLVKDSKYFNFLFFQIFGAILPSLPALFQARQHSKQNLDTCYINYLCSVQMLHLNTFNSVVSVSSLAVVGLINLIIVFRKKIFCYQVSRVSTTHGIQQRDAPKVIFLLSMVANGMLGTITNNCPDKTNLYFYTYTCLWMFFSAILWMYSKRHGVRRWQPYFIITVSSAFGCLTFVENMLPMSPESRLMLKMVFLFLSTLCSGYLCKQYYFERPSGLQTSQWITNPFCEGKGKVLDDGNKMYRPLRSKIVYVVLTMAFSLYCPLSTLLNPTGSVTFSIFNWAKGQVAIYFFFYLAQKLRFERSTFSVSFIIVSLLLTVIFVILEVIAHGFLSFRYFAFSFPTTYSVSLTPAKSRELNKECLLPGTDWNDIRHYNFAFSWFMFIVLMDYIDSNLKGVPKKRIFVF